ncbi:hypothetical protein C0J52_01579 [Blattella germanica]|nr:hypothetical protein C0J52_01579 [Blattella germanica]
MCTQGHSIALTCANVHSGAFKSTDVDGLTFKVTQKSNIHFLQFSRPKVERLYNSPTFK